MIIIYSKENCSYCKKAKELLNSLGFSYNEINVLENPDWKDSNPILKNVKTVPQIFIDDIYIGGYTELEKKFNYFSADF
jgi:glutaredoxin